MIPDVFDLLPDLAQEHSNAVYRHNALSEVIPTPA
jgi:hypothetical protein